MVMGSPGLIGLYLTDAIDCGLGSAKLANLIGFFPEVKILNPYLGSSFIAEMSP
jgi:hypothetical protein